MSTRSQIGFYQNEKEDILTPEVLLYRHCDGMPERVIPDILPRLKDYNQYRGSKEIDYMSARLLQHLCNLHDEQVPKDDMTYRQLSYGIDAPDCFHGDIEYFYRINADESTVEVFEAFNFQNGQWQFKPIEKHNF